MLVLFYSNEHLQYEPRPRDSNNLIKFVLILFSMQIEMMSESIDETLDKDEAEEETEELTNQVDSSLIVLLFSCIG